MERVRVRGGRAAVGFWVVTALVALAAGVLHFLSRNDFGAGDMWPDVLADVAVLIYATLGLLIVVRAGSVIGRLMMGIALFLGLLVFGTGYAMIGLRVSPGSLPAVKAVAAATQYLWLPGLVLLGLMFLLFPDGHPPSRRWRGVATALAAVGAVGLAALLLNPEGTLSPANIEFGNPFAVPALRGVIHPLLAFVAWVEVGLILLCLVALFVRRRRSGTAVRQQLKWLALAGLVAPVGLAFSGIAQGVWGENSVIANAGWMVFLLALILGVPIAITLALFRYGLYEIDVIMSKTVLYGLLAAFFTAVYLAIVVGLGTAIGSNGNSFLTALAAVVVAVAFQPARVRATRLANRLVYGKRATPYEVLSQFSGRVGEAYATEDVLPRMARILAEGTGATRASVWLRVGQELHEAASWPSADGHPSAFPMRSDDLPALPEVDAVVPVRDRGELLGALGVAKAAGDPLTPGERKLLDDLAGQAGLVVRNVALIADLRASRQRLVAAQDQERRRLERNIHDGAQQQLVALSVKQRLAATLLDRDREAAARMLEELQRDTADAIDNLRDLARGIYPPLLADQGLVAALQAQVRKAAIPVTIEAEGVSRYPQEAEAGVYFCCLEALQNVAKYAGATRVVVHLSDGQGQLSFQVTDDGHGFDPNATSYGSGLQGMADRLAALGGRLEVRSSPGAGTTVGGSVPVPVAASQSD